jgi:hypothetical protein
MKNLILFCTVLVLGSLVVCGADKPAGADRLLHVVSFKFKPSATPEQISKVTDAFRELKTKIPGIEKFEWGTNVSPEKHDKGFTHGFILTFKTEQARDIYLGHPEHKAFGKLLGPILDDVFVLDYWAQH